MGVHSAIRQHAFFQDFDESHQLLLADCASLEDFPEEHYIFRQQNPANTFYIIVKGMVSLEFHDNVRGQLHIMTLKPGDLLGWSWLNPPYQWAFDAKVIKDTEAIAINAACLRTKMDEEPVMGYQLLKKFTAILERRLQSTRIQLMDIYGESQQP